MKWTPVIVFIFMVQFSRVISESFLDETTTIPDSWENLPTENPISNPQDEKAGKLPKIKSPQDSGEDIRQVLKALNLPEDFATGSGNVKSKSNKNPIDQSQANVEFPTFPLQENLNEGLPIQSTTSETHLYMTENAKLNRILNCPCKKYQLDALGVKSSIYQPNQNQDLNSLYNFGNNFKWPVFKLSEDPKPQILQETRRNNQVNIKKIKIIRKKKQKKVDSKTSGGNIFGLLDGLFNGLSSVKSIIQPLLNSSNEVSQVKFQVPQKKEPSKIPVAVARFQNESPSLWGFLKSRISTLTSIKPFKMEPLTLSSNGTIQPTNIPQAPQATPLPSAATPDPQPKVVWSTLIITAKPTNSPPVPLKEGKRDQDLKWNFREMIKQDIDNHKKAQARQIQT